MSKCAQILSVLTLPWAFLFATNSCQVTPVSEPNTQSNHNGEDSPNDALRQEVHRLQNASDDLAGEGNLQKAMETAQQAILLERRIYRDADANSMENLAEMLENLAAMLRRQHRWPESRAAYVEAVAIRERLDGKANGPGGRYLVDDKEEIRDVNVLERTTPKQFRLLADAIELDRQSVDLESLQHNYPDAIEKMKQVLKIKREILGPESREAIKAENQLADYYEKNGNFDKAEELLRGALETWEKTLGADHPWVAAQLTDLAQAYQADRLFAQAEPLLKRAMNIREKTEGSESPILSTALENLAQLYEAEGNYTNAEPLLHRALEILQKKGRTGTRSVFAGGEEPRTPLYGNAEVD